MTLRDASAGSHKFLRFPLAVTQLTENTDDGLTAHDDAVV